MSEDQHSGVRAKAAEALGKLGAVAATSEVIARLAVLIQDGHADVRSRSADALGKLGAVAARSEVLAQLMKLLNKGTKIFRVNVALACVQAGAKLDANCLTVLMSFWQKHLSSDDFDEYCGVYQELSAAAYKQLKHLAAIHMALPLRPLGKSRVRKAPALHSRKASRKS